MSRSAGKIINAEKVRHLASLSRLKLTPTEEKRLVREMGEIVSYFATIDRARVEGLEPSYHAVEIPNASREDEPQPSDPDAVLRIVPSKKGRHVKAPRVF